MKLTVVAFLSATLACAAPLQNGLSLSNPAMVARSVTSGGGGGIALVSQVLYSPNAGSATTSPTINTTGASLIVVVVGTYDGWAPTAMVDSASNTWTALTSYVGGGQAIRIYYKLSPTTSSTHTFTPTVPQTYYCTFTVMAFSGVASYQSTAGENGFAGGPTGDTIQPGSVTPSVNGALIVSGVSCYGVGASPTINSSFDATYGVAKFGNAAMGGAAYKVQTTAAAINPTWTSVGINGGSAASNIAVFLP
jgi:hypothetical protein